MPNKDSNPHEVEIVHPKRGVWQTYDVTAGLPAGVFRLLQDRQGYLWLGTEAGLCRYDGAEFITYTTADGLVHNTVWAICEDHWGRLWLGTGWWSITGRGVSCFDGQRFQTYTTADGLADNSVRVICEDRQGRLWFGTSGGGVSCFDGKHFITYTTADGLADNSVRVICEDRQGRLWFGTSGGGVSCFDGKHFINYTTADGLAHNTVWAICEDRQGRLWFGTWGGGVSCFDLSECNAQTGGRGFTTYTTEDGLLDNRVNGIIQDREGYFWFAHFLSGLTRFDTETLQLLTAEPAPDILIQDRQGRLWFSNENDLCCIFDGQQRRQTFINARRIYSLLEDSRGYFWVGTAGDGLYCYDSADAVWEGVGKHFTTASGSGRIRALSLLEARDGTIWVGTEGFPGCLCRFDGKVFEAIPTPHREVWRLFEDIRGLLWMGGWHGGGLSCYDGEKLVTYTMSDGLPDDRIQSIVEDDTGCLWIGTGQGLCRFDGVGTGLKSARIYEKAQGLFSLFHERSTKDVTGQLWFGTLMGGFYRTDGKHFQWLTMEDGLPSNSITGLVPQPDGSMIIGTYRGIVHYRPTATLPPRIEIREVVADRVYRNPIELELTATGGQPSGLPLLTISYHGLSFATRRMRYSYILEGYDTQWQDTWENHVRYENLPVGEYTFKVIAINRDLVCSEAPAILKLTILPDPRNHRIAQLEEQIREQERAELERVHQELEDARQVQQSLLPLSAPQIKGFEIAGTSLPAKEVGGDFYDYLSLGDNVGIVLADVSGKSMKAAMVAAMANGMLHAEVTGQTSIWNSPSAILRELNAALRLRLIHRMYTTMSLGILKAGEKRLLFSNAGQPYPIVKRGEKTWELEVNGLPLGVIDSVEYTELSVDLEAGDFVVFYSDGIIEAADATEEMYQVERLLEVVKQADLRLSAQGMVDRILQEVALFVGDVEQYDDITIVVVRCL